VRAFLDTGFLLTVLTHRSGAEKAWVLLKECEMPSGISSLQLFFIRHGLTKNLADAKEADEVHDLSVRGIKLLDWLIEQEVVRQMDIDYEEVVATAEKWCSKIRTPLPSLLVIWAAAASVSGANAFLSFDPRTRALAESAGLKVLPETL
jgi:hypothetical protein